MRNLDENLMSRFREGDREVLRMVYDDLHPKLIGYVAYNFNHEAEEIEDIVATAFVRIFKKERREGMKSAEHIQRYIFITVRNLSIDSIRANKKDREFIHGGYSYLLSETEDDRENEKQFDMDKLMSSVAEMIEKLPKQRRAILIKYFLHMKGTHEIAEEMQLNSQTVLNHKAKALESLRKWVKRLHLSYPG